MFLEKSIAPSLEKCVSSIISRICVICLRFLWRKHGKCNYQYGNCTKIVRREIPLWRFYGKISVEIVWGLHGENMYVLGKSSCLTISMSILPQKLHKKYHSLHCLHTTYMISIYYGEGSAVLSIGSWTDHLPIPLAFRF